MQFRRKVEFCSLVILSCILVGCGGSSSSETDPVIDNDPISGDDPTVGDDPLLDNDSVTLTSQQLSYEPVYINGQSIELQPGDQKTISVVLVRDDTSLVSMELQDSPDWISVDADNNLAISVPQSGIDGQQVPFTVNYTVANSAEETFTDSVAPVVFVAKSTVVLRGLLPASGGVVATAWDDVRFSSDGDLDNAYEVSFSLVENSLSSYRFKVEYSPQLTESDVERINVEHAPLDELYVNYGVLNADIDNALSKNESSVLSGLVQARSRVNSESSNHVPVTCSRLEYEETDKDHLKDSYLMNNVWWGTTGYFIDNVSWDSVRFENGGEPRVLPEKESLAIASQFKNRDLAIKIECASALQSTFSLDDLGSIDGREPVLLVHGFDPSGALGGKDYYFGKLPGMIQQLEINEPDLDPRRFFPLTFRWQTNARFEVVAEELANAIELINSVTEKKVHIVSHSFGGVLVRTLMQGLAHGSNSRLRSKEELEGLIASFTTVGSPHSGIYSGSSQYTDSTGSWAFERGFAPATISGIAGESCSAINCHQLGQEYSPLSWIRLPSEVKQKVREYIGLDEQATGRLAFQLATTYPDSYPLIPTNVLIGQRIQLESDGFQDGLPVNLRRLSIRDDGLISSYGQLWKSQFDRDFLLEDIEGKPVSEHFLGHERLTFDPASEEFMPGLFDDQFGVIENSDFLGGYLHSTKTRNALNPTEVGFERCDANNLPGCDHAAWHYILNILSTTGEQATELNEGAQIEVSGTVLLRDNPLAATFVSISFPNGRGVSTQTDENGNFSASLPFYANSEIVVFVDPNRSTIMSPIPGLRSETRTLRTVTTASESSGIVGLIRISEPVLSEGNLLLAVNDASTGEPLNEFEYSIINSGDVRVAQGQSGEAYSIDQMLPLDTYNVSISVNGYADITGFVCEHTAETSQCVPALDPAGFIAQGGLSAVLTWAQNPQDLDSHIIKLTSNEIDYNVYFANQQAANAALDVDDVSSFGPETITVQALGTQANDRYIYAVHHYSGSGSITSTANAQVRVSIGGSAARVFTPPTNELSSSKDFWKVFEIRSGTLIPCSQGCIFSSIAEMVSQSNGFNSKSKRLNFSNNSLSQQSKYLDQKLNTNIKR